MGSGSGKKRSRSESDTSHTPDEDCESTRNKRLRHGSTSPSITRTDSVSTPGVSVPSPYQEHRKEEISQPGIQPQDDPSHSEPTDEAEEMTIASIRATDVALGLRRLPAGFYSTVLHSELEWRTENKPSSVNHDVVEWDGPIPIPSNPSATVHIEVYASFEFQPMLGAGEQLQRLTTTVEQLLDCSARDSSFTFLPVDGDVVSSCSSISVTVKRKKRESSSSSPSRVIDTHYPTLGSPGELAEATNRGHGALSRYQKYGERRDLEHSISEFVRALRLCPLHHLSRAAAQSNLAMAKFILCQVEGRDALLPLGLYYDALRTRSVGHVDRPSTLIQLAAVHFARFEKLKDEVEGAKAETLLHEVIELSSADTHESRAAMVMLQLHAGHSVGPVQLDVQSSAHQDSTSRFTGEGLHSLSARLLVRFERFGDLADLQQAITALKESVRSTAIWDDRYGAGLANLGVALLHRFKHVGELSDIDNAISTLRDAVDLTPHGHSDNPTLLINLGSCFLARFKRLGELNDLENSISTFRDAVDLTPHGHPDNPTILNNLGSSYLTRFERLGELSDLENGILMLRNAVDLTPPGHHRKPSHLSNLGASFRTRFERLGELGDLKNAISTLRDAVELTPRGHPEKPGRLSKLGSSLTTLFGHVGELSDLEGAISTLKDAVDLTPHGHPDKPSRLSNLGTCFRTRFERLGELSDLEDAILTLRHAVDLTPHGHPDKPGRLGSLGISCQTRFKHAGELSDLENAISTLKDAVDLTPHDHPGKPGRLSNLGTCFKTRFERLGKLTDLENAISTFREAVQLIPHSHPEKPGHLRNLGTCFRTRFERLGELSDLENAVSMLRHAVDLAHDHPGKPGHLNNLGTSLKTRFDHLGQLSDLENLISVFRDAVDLTPHGDPHKPGRLSNLGASFKTRFKHLGELGDLENAISTLRDAVHLTPHGHSDKPAILNNLGSSIRTRFERLGELSDLEDSISTFRDAVDLTPSGHPSKPGRLSDLGASFRARFERLGELNDLGSAISTLKDAVDLTPHGHPNKPTALSNLGTSFITRFQRRGELSDLENAISTLRDAVDLTPLGHPTDPTILSNFGTSLLTRFERLGELSDLGNAISSLKDAVNLIPHGHSDKPALLNNLGTSFLTQFERVGELSDLENAISMLGDAVDLAPHGHPEKPAFFDSLGTSFRTRFERLGQLGDLENSVSMLRHAVDLTPHGHPAKPAILDNLSTSFRTRFKGLGGLSDLEMAISTSRDAVDLTPHGHPQKPSYLSNLATSFIARFERLGELNDLEHALFIYYHAASSPFGPIRVRFHASQRWISCARHVQHYSLLHAYSVAINLLPQLAWIGLSLTHRYSELVQGADVVRDAAAAALDSGFPETAVEWLERGRSIVWGELFQLRSPYEELSSAHPDHASRLRELSVALDHAGATREKWLSEQTPSAPESLQQYADRHRALAIERDTLLQEIRRFPGFERFLLQKEFVQLRASAHAGPVVILNAAETHCDALMVLANVGYVIHVPLPNFTFKRSLNLRNTLKTFVRQARDGRRETQDSVTWESILFPLWRCVIKPVLDALAISTPGDLLRIFWCPTGPFAFLPIHAAGFYDPEYSQPGHKIFDFVVSSYVPSLSILAPLPVTESTGNLRFLVVRQPPSDGLHRLPGVVTELNRIREVIGSSPSACTTIVESSTGTVEEVLSLMKEADWVHFACHGIQDSANPTDSGLCLADRRCLKLVDIITLSRPQRGLAFLSACQTATGDDRLSDEAIHMTAGMLFAGYGGVIGTMWSISDRLAPDVARHVYEYLFRDGTRPDYREAARGLHEAIGHVRDIGIASFDEWIPFIHVGL